MKRRFKNIQISKQWIEENLLWKEWNRTIYPSKVNKLAGKIKNGEFIPEVPIITVAEDGNKFVIIDGQHTIKAIDREGIKFDIDFKIFSEINEDEMITMYSAINDVKQFRVIDDIKVHIGRHRWLDEFFTGNFPIEVTLHGGVNSMKIGDILIVLHGGLRTSKKRNSLSRSKLPFFLSDLDGDKFKLMKDFCELYIKCFGLPHRDNWLYKNAIMLTVMKIWYKNKENYSSDDFIKRFRPIERVSSIRQISTAGGFDSTAFEIMLKQIYKTVNKGYSQNKFVPFWDKE